MKKKSLTFTKEELEDLKFAILREVLECKYQHLERLYKIKNALYIKIKSYIED